MPESPVPMLEPFDLSTVRAAESAVYTSMDPRLQWKVLKRASGQEKLRSSSTERNEVAVIARVSSRSDWEARSEVTAGAVLGAPTPDGAGVVTEIVTARVPVGQIEELRRLPFVESLKAATPVQGTLSATTKEIGALAKPLRTVRSAAGGQSVLVGVVDFGMAFAHENFRDAKGRTRLLGIWDQNASATTTSPFGYGRLYDATEIDAALKSKKKSPYDVLRYGPDPSESNHGTHVTDIAAGNGRGSGAPGVASGAQLLFVQLASSDVPWEGPEVVGKSFGDSVQLLEAVAFIFEKAAGRPCVVNLSLGTNGGPHDGTSLVEQGLDRLVLAAPNRAIVIAASNSFGDDIHAQGTVPPGGTLDVKVRLKAPHRDAEIELWYGAADRFDVELLAPGGRSLLTVASGESLSLETQGEVVGLVANRLKDPNNGGSSVGVFLGRRMPGGEWTIRLRGKTVAPGGGLFHAWIERDDATQATFASPTRSHDLGSVSCGQQTIVVGSYDAHKETRPLSFFSAAGPTRDGRQKPEISAPGQDVMAADSRSTTGITRMSGTSMASPAVAGVVALMLGQAQISKVNLTTGDIRRILTTTARRGPPAGAGWDPRYGAGRVDAEAAVAAVAAMGSAASIKPAPAGLGAVSKKQGYRRASARSATAKRRPR